VDAASDQRGGAQAAGDLIFLEHPHSKVRIINALSSCAKIDAFSAPIVVEGSAVALQDFCHDLLGHSTSLTLGRVSHVRKGRNSMRSLWSSTFDQSAAPIRELGTAFNWFANFAHPM